MSNHDIQNDNEEKFVPLKDNNNNLSAVKSISYIVLLGGLIFCLTAGIQYAGAYISNQEQMEFKLKHHRFIKDSNENKILVTKALLESKESKEKENIQAEEKKTEVLKEYDKKDDSKIYEKDAEEKNN